LRMRVLTHEPIEEIIEVVPAESEDEGANLLKGGDVVALVVIPEGVSDVASLGTKSLRVTTDPRRAVSGQIVASIVGSFTQQYSAVATAMRGLWPLLHVPASGAPNDVAGPPEAAGLHEGVTERILSATVRAAGLFSVTEEKPEWITARQYYRGFPGSSLSKSKSPPKDP
jgi:hypothetical protein